MRRFIDFWIRPKSIEEAAALIKCAKRLGFSGVVVELGEALPNEFNRLRSMAEEYGISIYRKLVIRPGGRRDLLKLLREHRGRFEVITVVCENIEVALVAARDSRVDTLIIPPKARFRLDRGVASLIRNRVELPFAHLLECEEAFIETAMKIIEILGPRVEIVISSGASNELSLRGPRELASLLEVLGYVQERALDSVSKIPEKILQTNLLKLSRNYVARGVIKTGEET